MSCRKGLPERLEFQEGEKSGGCGDREGFLEEMGCEGVKMAGLEHFAFPGFSACFCLPRMEATIANRLVQ